MPRTFTGRIDGLEVGSKFIVITGAGSRPHIDTRTREAFVVTKREEGRVTAKRFVDRIDEILPIYEAYAFNHDARLTKIH
jgi:hypothetical protein